MRDIPVFTTENGVASLTLKQIPYTGAAYIKIQATAAPQAFLQECRDFCRMAGAENIYAAGHAVAEAYPLHTRVLQMTAARQSLPDTDTALMPVTESTLEEWRQLYNRRMAGVDNAAYMTKEDARQMLARGDGYFVHRGDSLLGIGVVSEDRLEAIASAIPGAGRDVVLALCHGIFAERVVLEVASTNEKAIRLYENLGFLKIGEVSRWYRVDQKSM